MAVFEELSEDPTILQKVAEKCGPLMLLITVAVRCKRLWDEYSKPDGEIPSLFRLGVEVSKELAGAGCSVVGAHLGAALGAVAGPVGVVFGACIGAYLGRRSVQQGIEWFTDFMWPHKHQVNCHAIKLDFLHHKLDQRAIQDIKFVVQNKGDYSEKETHYTRAKKSLDQQFKWFALSCHPRFRPGIDQCELEARFVAGHTSFIKLKTLMLKSMPRGTLRSLEDHRLELEEKDDQLRSEKEQKESLERSFLAQREEMERERRAQEDENQRKQDEMDELRRQLAEFQSKKSQ